jgi:glycine oxidase
VNVIVIGAGIIGAAVAEELALRGARVQVLEMRAAGGGASWASAGLLAPYTEADPSSPLLAMGVRSLSMYDGFIARVRERSGRPIEYARTGTLEVAVNSESAVRLRASVDAFAATDTAVRWLSPDDVRRLEPSVTRRSKAPAFVDAHGFVGVQSLVAALVQSARLAGASFETPAQAVAIEVENTGVTVIAGDRRISADHVVLAAGSWSPRVRISDLPPLPVRPVRGQLLRLGWTASERPGRVVWTDDCYIVPWSDGTVLVGRDQRRGGFRRIHDRCRRAGSACSRDSRAARRVIGRAARRAGRAKACERRRPAVHRTPPPDAARDVRHRTLSERYSVNTAHGCHRSVGGARRRDRRRGAVDEPEPTGCPMKLSDDKIAARISEYTGWKGGEERPRQDVHDEVVS